MSRAASRWLLGATFGALLVLGLWRGEALTVLRNALLLCLSCMGLGR